MSDTPETSLVGRHPLSHASVMFTVSEAEAAAIRAAFEQGGELSAAVALRRLFPGVADNTEARECARTIAAWKPLPAAEKNGFDDVWLSEHHFIDDGYPPSIVPVAAAIATRTERIRIASGVLLMPFHNPIRLAEDIATVDVISGGRFELGVGIGFKREEYAGFGVSSRKRGTCTDQSLEILRRALTGETVTFKSEFFDFQNIRVTPEPIQKPYPPIWSGGFTPAALRRAVRFGDGFTVPGATRDVYDHYVAGLKQEHRPTDGIRFASGFWFLIVSDDPEKTFAEAADHVIYQVDNYSEWLQAAGLQPLVPHPGDREALKQSGLLQVVDADMAISVSATSPMPSRSHIFICGRCRLGCRHGGRKIILSYSPRRSSQRFVDRIEGWALGTGHRRCEVHSRKAERLRSQMTS